MVAVCVFCSASDVLDEKYRVIARKTGTLIGEKDCTLVYGRGAESKNQKYAIRRYGCKYCR